jgi:hypothetical protein
VTQRDSGRQAHTCEVPQLQQRIERVCVHLLALEGELNALDVPVGDGDTGSSVAGRWSVMLLLLMLRWVGGWGFGVDFGWLCIYASSHAVSQLDAGESLSL